MKFHASALRAEGGKTEEIHEITGVPGLRGRRLSRRETLILQFCRQELVDALAVETDPWLA